MNFKNKKAKFILVFILITFVYLIFFSSFFKNEETKIFYVLDQVIKEASYEKELHPFEKLAKANNILPFLADNISFQVDHKYNKNQVILGKEDFKKHLLGSYSYFVSLNFSYRKKKIKISKNFARLNISATANGLEKDLATRFYRQENILIQLNKNNGDWLISSIESLE